MALAIVTGCHSTPTPALKTSASTPVQYPTRPATPPPPFKLFHQTDTSLTLVVPDSTTDDQLTALLYQLHDAARAHTFNTIHLPQPFIDHRDPIVWFHIYRGAKCAPEKYSGHYPCGPSYHAAADYTLGSFSTPNRDDAILYHTTAPETHLWNPDTP